MSQEYIEIKGARVNNLKNIDVRIPRNKFVVISGVSGSGKSSLAFDTLYAEGQRRYVESLSSYARQFLGRMNKPECDFIRGIPPAIAIEQKVIARNPRSTVGTSTEIYEYLRLLFARIGRTYSPISGEEVKKHSTEDVVQKMLEFSEGTKFVVMAPIKVPEGRTLEQQLKACILQGYSRMTSPGTPDGEQFIRIDDYLESNPESEPAEMPYLVIDRLSSSDNKETISRLVDSAETAFFEGHGEMRLMVLPSGLSYDFSTRFEADGITFEEPTDQLFSFNSPAGACPECQGFGKVMGIDEHLVIPDTGLSVYDGCVVCWHGEKMGEWKNWFIRHAANDDFPIFEPYYNLTQQQKDWLWHGLPSDRGAKEKPCIDAFFQMVKENQYKIQYRVMLARYRGKTTCPTCHGTRLKPEAEYVKINGRSITDLVQMPVIRLKDWFAQLQLPEHDAEVGKRLLLEITSRLQFLLDVGLGYLTLNRLSNSLSGGESQRINLCTSLGSSLVGSLYILDEPSIGLHSRDTDRLIHVLKELQALGNTVVVVEHDEEIIRAADYIIDIGPDAGRLGGEVVYAGEPSTTSATSKTSKTSKPSTPSRSYTLQYLSGEETIPVPASRRPWNRHIDIKGARMNNLRGINVEIPLNVLTVVTGVSGSGKSSLIKGILYPALKRHMGDVCDAPGEYSGLAGDLDAIRRVEFVDQNPIGKSSRSNPATYVKAYDAIRDLYADQPLSQQMGFTPQYFSFNADGGRCDECKGAGTITVEMQFMADLVLECEACHGKRFKHDILDVKYEGKNIDDILNMTITEAIEFFKANGQKTIVNRLKPLEDVGLGYIKLGQNSSTLSGGENQRVKLAYFIGQEKQEPTLFIFDEPTTGLHFHDIKRLMSSLDALIARGHTVLIIEHNMDVIKLADHVIDLGPDGGDKGGNLVIAGTPEEVAKCKNSITGQYLKLKI
ncbi:excinuclease ABC subunit UvrA [Prevotella communis]|uniref:excinuclease ABC subunit UvrA n=1 Tax=Prevotella communis TaxID=2913614 RepID=UPI001EDA93A9|nr:excinuclease ABC subunit UvrA [Prevotella communis]UKK68734.1 excinuclease ABC subunit UvrA [Prevotella communis]UKK71791.1 excinuclease ABC subunit UvrA [Prevotella communis]